MSDDILSITPPAGIPGVLFNAITDELFKRYPISRKKAQHATVAVLEIMVAHFEEVENAQ